MNQKWEIKKLYFFNFILYFFFFLSKFSHFTGTIKILIILIVLILRLSMIGRTIIKRIYFNSYEILHNNFRKLSAKNSFYSFCLKKQIPKS